MKRSPGSRNAYIDSAFVLLLSGVSEMSEPASKRIDLKTSSSGAAQEAIEIVHQENVGFMDHSIFATTTQQAVVERLNQGRALPKGFQRIDFGVEDFDEETSALCADIATVSALREKWLFVPRGTFAVFVSFFPLHSFQNKLLRTM